MHATGYKTGAQLGIYNARFYEGPLSRRRDRRQDDEVERSRLRRRVSDSRGPAGDQRVHRAARAASTRRPRCASSGRIHGTTRARSARRANTLMAQGADVVTNHTDSTSVVQAAEEKRQYALGYHSDMSKYGPEAQLTATTHQWGDFYTKAVERRSRGNLEDDQRLGRNEGWHDQARAAQSGDPGRREGARREAGGGDQGRHAAPVRADPSSIRTARRAFPPAGTCPTTSSARWTSTSKA